MFRTPASRGHLKRGDLHVTNPLLWTPEMLGDAVVAWWDMLDPNTVVLEGQGVTRILDKSGNGHDLMQDDTMYQPKWVEHTVNHSFEAAFYDGRNDYMEADFSIEHPFTVVQMIRTGDELEPYASSFQGGVNDALVYLRNVDLGNEVVLNAGSKVRTGKVLLPETNYILVSQFDDANSLASINGEVITTPNTGTTGVGTGPRV